MTLTKRQRQIAGLVAQGFTNKQIAAQTRLSRKTVDEHIREAAGHIPGDSYPRHKLTLWFFNLTQPDKAA